MLTDIYSRHKQNMNSKVYQKQSASFGNHMLSQQKRTNKSNLSYESTHIQNIRDSQQIAFLENRNQQSNKYFRSEYDDLSYGVERQSIEVRTKMKQNGENLSTLLIDLQEFSGSVSEKNFILSGSSQFGQRDSLLVNALSQKNNLQASHSCSNQMTSVLKTGLRQKIQRNFNIIAEQQSITSKNVKEEMKKLQQRLQQKQGQLNKNQRYQRQLYLQLISLSQGSLQKIEGSLYQMNRRTQQILHKLQDTTQVIDSQLSACIEKQVEANKRDTRIIEGLIEKMIYKMMYL